MSDHRWQGYTHRELFDRVHQGPGPEASTTSVRRWAELSRALEEIDSGLAAAINSARADWEGAAADSAREGLHPLGEWARRSREAAERMRGCSEQQAELIGRVRAEMPPPVPVTAEEPGFAESALVHLFGGQTDYELQEARRNAAEQHAFDVMRTYQEATEANTTSLAAFTPPPQVVVDTPPASPSRGPAAPGQHGVTITWGGSTPRTTGPGSGGGRSPVRATTNTGGRSRTGSAGRTTGSGQTSTGSSAGRSAGRGVGDRRYSEEETEPIDRAVTEEVGEAGTLFDEPRTLSRPVIGGDPG